MKQEYLQVRISEEEKNELNEVVTTLPGDVTVSQFVRDAFREKIAIIKQQKAEAEAAGAAA
jgi:hypothetical protein